MFITFEGGDGCGKSTHAKLLKEFLKKQGYKVVLTREPGGTSIGKKIRKMVLKGEKLYSRFSELLLFGADRAEHVERVIKPALDSGKIVISDRFIDSTTAYQSGGRGLPKSVTDLVNGISSGGIIPDVTFLLDVAPAKGIERGTRYTGKDKFESEKGSFHTRVRTAYMRIAKSEPRRVKIINTCDPIGSVQEQIRKIINEKL